MDGPLYRALHAVLILRQSLVEVKLICYAKILIVAIISLIQYSQYSSFLQHSSFSIYNFSYEKKYTSNKHLIQLFIFIFASKPSWVSLRYSVCQLPGKVDN